MSTLDTSALIDALGIATVAYFEFANSELGDAQRLADRVFVCALFGALIPEARHMTSDEQKDFATFAEMLDLSCELHTVLKR